MEEVYKDIPNYEGIYKISESGIVISLDRKVEFTDGRVRFYKSAFKKPVFNVDRGYMYVMLYDKYRKQKNHSIHQLVAQAFLNHTPDGYNSLIVDHIDNNRLNNNLKNLNLTTPRHNTSKDKVNGTSSCVGVCWHKGNNKWVAAITIGAVKKHLGYFVNEIDASEAYKTELKKQ